MVSRKLSESEYQKEEEMEKGGEEEGRSTRGPEFSSDANGSRPDEVTNRTDE
jgi:hypothetical protein